MSEPGDRASRAAAGTQIVLISGLSGSGKSTVGKAFEDLGYYCIDNLPLPFLRSLIDEPSPFVGNRNRVAVVTDLRTPGFPEEFPRIVGHLDRRRVQVTLLFLEASDEVLIRRFSETRRPHPQAEGGAVLEGIRRERAMMAEVRGLADMVLDSSHWSVHEIRSQVIHAFGEQGAAGLQVSLASFGFKHGIPYGTDLLFDVRFLPNPHFEPGLRDRTGLDEPVRQYLEAHEEYHELVERLAALLIYLLPRYEREQRSYLSVAVGCTGGKHRSVAVGEALARRLGDEGWPIRLAHRDIRR